MLHLMETAWVFVHLDPRREEVKLPEFLRQQKHLILQYGYNMPVPITDLAVDERGISATLSFQRVPHATFVPWSAVFAMVDTDKRGYVWEDDLPADLNLPEPPEPPAAAKSGPTLGLQQGGQRPGQKPGKKPRPSHLKLVD
jgi:hypothetical protein